MDIVQALNDSFTWIHQLEAKRNLVWLYVLTAIVGVLLIGIGFEFISTHAMQWVELIATADASDPASAAVYEQVMNEFFTFIATIIGILILSGFIQLFIQYRMVQNALHARGKKTEPIGLIRFVRLIAFEIYQVLVAGISWYDKKWMPLPLGVLLLAVISSATATPTLVPVIMILSIIYLPILIRNQIRLFPAQSYLVEKDDSITGVCKRAWHNTTGQALDIFITALVCGLAIGIAFLVVSAITSAIVSILISPLVQSIVMGWFAELPGIEDLVLVMAGFATNQVSQGIGQFIWAPLAIVTQAFLYIAICTQIAKEPTVPNEPAAHTATIVSRLSESKAAPKKAIQKTGKKR